MWRHQSDFGISSALSAQVQPGVFFGAEVRYVRSYDGLGLDTFTGQAVFICPTLYARISEQVWISAAWNVQVAGRAADDPGSLDLANFERHQVKCRMGFNF